MKFIKLAILIYLIFFISSWATHYVQTECKINEIHVYPVLRNVKKEELKKILSENLGKNLFNVNLKNIKRKLARVSWVSKINIKRRWSNRLDVYVDEYFAQAIWKDKLLIDQYGTMFSVPRDSFPKEAAILNGPDGSAVEIISYYIKMKEILSPLGLSITSIDTNNNFNWHLVLDDKIDLILGSHDLLDRLKNFVRIYSKIFQKKNNEGQELKRADMRYKDGGAMIWGKKLEIVDFTNDDSANSEENDQE